MPRYNITDPKTGRSVTLEGESPPTEQELEEIFAAVDVATPTPKPVETSNLGAKAANFAGDLAAEAGGATAGQMIGTALAPFTFGASVPIGGAIGGGIGNTVAQWRRMGRGDADDFSWGELAGASAVSAIPGSGMLKAAKGVGPRAVAGNIGKAAVEGAALTTAQQAVKVAIDEQRVPTWDDLKFSAAGGLAFGAGVGGLGSFARKIVSVLNGKQPAEAKAIIASAMEGRTGDELDALKNLQAKIDEGLGIGGEAKSARNSALDIASQMQDEVKSAADSARVFTDTSPSAGRSALAFMDDAAIDESLTKRGIGLQSPELLAIQRQGAINALPLNTIPGKSASDSASVFQKQVVPLMSAEESASVFQRAFNDGQSPEALARLKALYYDLENAANDTERRSIQFEIARTEQGLKDAVDRRLGGDEVVNLGDNDLRNQRTVAETRRGDSAKEIARINAALAAQAPKIPNDSIRAKLSPQAQRMADEYGRIDPKVLQAAGYATARLGAGFIYGSSQGETPEERLGNGLLYGSMGVAASPALARSIGRKIADTDVAKKTLAYVLPEVVLGEASMLWQNVGHVASSISRDSTWATKALATELKQFPQHSEAVQKFLTGDKAVLATLPKELAVAAQGVRTTIAEVQKLGIATGVFKGTMADKVADTYDSYLYRAYKIHSDPRYKPTEAAKNRFMAEYIKDYQARNSGLTPAALAADARDAMNRLLNRNNGGTVFDSAEKFAIDGAIVGKAGDVFKPRKNLSDATRELLGEIKDPIASVGQTVPRLARVIAAHETQKNMRELGLKTGLFTTRSSVTNTKELAEMGSKSYDQLVGLWTTPENAIALKQINGLGESHAVWRAWSTAVGIAKFNKTVLNPESYAPNLISALTTPLINGHLGVMVDPTTWGTSKAIVMDEIGLRKAPQAMEKTVRFLQKNGELNESISFDDLDRSFREATVRIPGSDKARTVLRGAAKIYGGSESIGRIVNFYGELARYKRAFPSLPEEELWQKALERNRATSAHASMVPQALKVASKLGVSNQYVNFTFEIFRTTYNSTKIGMEDMREGLATGNKQLQLEGAKRLAAVTAFVAAGSSIGLSAYSKRQHGIDDRQEEAMRRLSPSFDQSGMWQFHGFDGSKFSYANQSYVLPVSIPANALSAAAEGKDPWDAFKGFAGVMADQFLGDGGQILRPAIEMAMNRNEWDAQIVRGEAARDGWKSPEYAKGVSSHFVERSFLPAFVPQLGKWAKAARQEAGRDGQVYTLSDRFDRLAGMRINSIDIAYRLNQKAKGFAGRLAAESGIWNDAKKTARDSKALDESFARYDANRKRIFDDIRLHIEDATVLKQDRDATIKSLRAAGVPSNLLLGAIEGEYVPARREEKPTAAEIYEGMRTTPQSQQIARLNALALEDPFLARNVRGHIVGDMRDQARGRTAMDDLVTSLDIASGERTRYLQGKMDKLQTREEKMAYLQTMAQRGHVNPQVMQQLTESAIFR